LPEQSLEGFLDGEERLLSFGGPYFPLVTYLSRREVVEGGSHFLLPADNGLSKSYNELIFIQPNCSHENPIADIGMSSKKNEYHIHSYKKITAIFVQIKINSMACCIVVFISTIF